MTRDYNDKDILAPEEVAEHFGVSRKKVLEWTRRGPLREMVRYLGPRTPRYPWNRIRNLDVNELKEFRPVPLSADAIAAEIDYAFTSVIIAARDGGANREVVSEAIARSMVRLADDAELISARASLPVRAAP